jgi:hypothetical protein
MRLSFFVNMTANITGFHVTNFRVLPEGRAFFLTSASMNRLESASSLKIRWLKLWSSMGIQDAISSVELLRQSSYAGYAVILTSH